MCQCRSKDSRGQKGKSQISKRLIPGQVEDAVVKILVEWEEKQVALTNMKEYCAKCTLDDVKVNKRTATDIYRRQILPTSKTVQEYYDDDDDDKRRLLSDTRCMSKIDKQTVSLSSIKSYPNHFVYSFRTEQPYLLCHFWVSSILHFAANPEGSL
ncbi:hypothetical protein EDC96DRAFT_548051 [Choanephora cucurbitarum]|nr:hypothetical protein EDC96DRAFT_548051 [Choanephora cucurbitarum]